MTEFWVLAPLAPKGTTPDLKRDHSEYGAEQHSDCRSQGGKKRSGLISSNPEKNCGGGQ